MLNIQCEDMLEHEGLKQVLKDFRRVQVSRFPIIASCRQESIRFFDSRFISHKPIGYIEVMKDDKGAYVFSLSSRLILNDRFVRGNDRRHQKQTKDPKKLLRYMREFVIPWRAVEISDNSRYDHERNVSNWRYQAQNLANENCYVDKDIVMEEIVRMKAIGYLPQTQRFMDLMERGLPAYMELNRRKNREVMQVHVFINPDESVEIFCDDKMGYSGINQGTTTYMSINEAPMCIQQHVAMLRMMEQDTFVPEVGTKINDTNYWVEVFPE